MSGSREGAKTQSTTPAQGLVGTCSTCLFLQQEEHKYPCSDCSFLHPRAKGMASQYKPRNGGAVKS